MDLKKYEYEYSRALSANQEHIFSHYKGLNLKDQQALLAQAESINYTELARIFKETQQPREVDASTIKPPQTVNCFDGCADMKALGKGALQGGKVAFFLVAGGQGSRLGYDGPKGCYPVTPVKKKTLFEVFAAKIKAANKKYNQQFDWYIMTSVVNNQQTQEFFAQHDYFGMKENIIFFTQGMLPAVDSKGKILLKSRNELFMSPNGTGGIYDALVQNNLTNRMKEKGIEYLSYFQVDNPLGNFLDEGFLGHHINAASEMSTKVVRKGYPEEKVGVLAVQNGKTTIVEYIHMTKEQSELTNDDGSLTFSAGNIAMHIINRSFIDKIEQIGVGPYIAAHKKIAYINEKKELIEPTEPNGYKFERFVFDALSHAKNSVVFEVKRQEEFAPVKNATGNDSPESSTKLQSGLGKSWLEAAGFSKEYIDNLEAVEISPLIALTQEDFVLATKGKVESIQTKAKNKKLSFS